MKHVIKLQGLLIIALLLTSACSRNFYRFSKDENRYDLTTETRLADPSYQQKIEALYDAGKEGSFKGKEDVPVYYRIFEQEKPGKAIMISSGRTEAAIKYKELIYDLYQNGYSVYIHDHRGQGLSGRMTPNPEMGYVDAFQHYVDDMKYFYDHFVKPGNHEKVYLLAHSMGGAIGMTYLEQYPADFTAAAFSSPMLGLKSPICSAAKVLANDTPRFAVGQSEYKEDLSTFEGNALTGSQLRYNRMIEAYAQVPEARLGGATYQWLRESCKQFAYLFEHIDRIETPFILFSAENERIVYPYAHQKFITEAKKLGKDCKAFEVEDAEHELLIEKDGARTGTINATLDFYALY